MRPTWTRVAPGKRGWTKAVDRDRPAIEANFHKVLEDHTAGDPMRLEVKWTNLSRRRLPNGSLAGNSCQSPSSPSYPQAPLPETEGAEEENDGPPSPDRNAQFENIARLKKRYLKLGLPVVSIDTKKKELMGDFDRDGVIDTQGTIETNDHDFGSVGSGDGDPAGIYDVGRNRGFVHLNTSHDTSELACDSLAAWWDDHGRRPIPGPELLVLCDGGGSNSASRYVFKEELQKLANRLGIEIRVAHYPPYCSKYNPIEHRLFPHVTRACRGVIFRTLETVRYYMSKTETSTGLKVKVRHPREGIRDGSQVCRGVQEDHEDRLRRVPSQVELPGRPRARVKSGSYSRPIPKWSVSELTPGLASLLLLGRLRGLGWLSAIAAPGCITCPVLRPTYRPGSPRTSSLRPEPLRRRTSRSQLRQRAGLVLLLHQQPSCPTSMPPPAWTSTPTPSASGGSAGPQGDFTLEDEPGRGPQARFFPLWIRPSSRPSPVTWSPAPVTLEPPVHQPTWPSGPRRAGQADQPQHRLADPRRRRHQALAVRALDLPPRPPLLREGRAVLDLYAGYWQGKPLDPQDHILSATRRPASRPASAATRPWPPAPGRRRARRARVRAGRGVAIPGGLGRPAGLVMGRCEAKTGIEPFGRLVEQVMEQRAVPLGGAACSGWWTTARRTGARPR